MRYQDASFTVPASAGTAAYCSEHGHTMPDRKGKCVRCGNRVRFAEFLGQIMAPPRDGEDA